MQNNNNLKSEFINLFKNVKTPTYINDIFNRLFDDVELQFNQFQESFAKSMVDDSNKALITNRAYFKIVQNQNQIHQKLIEQNEHAIKKNIEENDRRKEHFFQNNSVNKAKSKLIISNAEIDSQNKILIAENKVADLIAETNKEIEVAKEKYLEVSDKLTKERDKELSTLSLEYQKQIDELRVHLTTRSHMYEQQITKLRQTREQYVFYNSESYKRIKDSHTNFSIYYNNKIDDLSMKYRNGVKIQNEENQLQIATVQKQIDLKKEAIEKMILSSNKNIERYSQDLKNKFNELKSKYDEDIRLIIYNQKNKISLLQTNNDKIDQEIKKQLDLLKNLYELSGKTKDKKKEFTFQFKDLNNQRKNNNKVLENEIKLIKEQNNSLIKKVNYEFALNKYNLDIDFLTYKYNSLLEKEQFTIKTRKEIKLLDLTIEIFEKEKNKKIALLNDAYNKELAYLERILAIGSQNQDMLIQDQVGENSYLLADNIYQNNVVKDAFKIDNDRYNLEVKKLKIKYQEDVQLVTSYYQLLTQKEIVKRQGLIKQYEYEIAIAKENLKREKYEIIYEFETLKIRNEYDLTREIDSNEHRSNLLDYTVNQKKIKLDNTTKKREANLQLQSLKAKAERNLEMFKIEVEKNDRFYLGILEFQLDYQDKINQINKLLSFSYDHPHFTVTQFYRLIDLLVSAIEEITNNYSKIIKKFYHESDEFFERKIEELTGFNYFNKLQQLLNTNTQSIDIVRNEIKKVTQEKATIETNLNILDAARHKDSIQIENLTKNISLMEAKKQSSKNDERILRLKEELSSIKRQSKINNLAAKQYESQIRKKAFELKPLEKRLLLLNKEHDNNKKRLYNQLNKDAKVYHRQRNNNTHSFNHTLLILNKYSKDIINRLSLLKEKLEEVVTAVDDYQIYHNKKHLQLTDAIHYNTSKFRHILLNLYFSQVNEQKQIVDNFHTSYASLIKNLNNNYETNYKSEKSQNDANLKKYELAQNRLHANFFHTNNQISKTFDARINNSKQELIKYDTLFQKAYTETQEMLKIIDENGDDLIIQLEKNTTSLINDNVISHNKLVIDKKNSSRKESEALAQLYEDTLHRSLQYRQNYLEKKKEISNSLKEWNHEYNLNAKNRERDYRHTIRKLKLEEIDVVQKYRVEEIKTTNKLKNTLNQKIKQIKLSHN